MVDTLFLHTPLSLGYATRVVTSDSCPRISKKEPSTPKGIPNEKARSSRAYGAAAEALPCASTT